MQDFFQATHACFSLRYDQSPIVKCKCFPSHSQCFAW